MSGVPFERTHPSAFPFQWLSSFETHRFTMLLRMRSQTLMVRSASSRVSNHKAAGGTANDSNELETAIQRFRMKWIRCEARKRASVLVQNRGSSSIRPGRRLRRLEHRWSVFEVGDFLGSLGFGTRAVIGGNR